MAKLDSTRVLAGRLFSKTRRNAARRGIDLTITLADVDQMLRAQRLRCVLTGIAFDLSPKGDETTSRCRPFYPSIDRIDASFGYSPDNIRIVCVAANYALCDWGEDVFRRIAMGFCNRIGLAVPGEFNDVRPSGVVMRKAKDGSARYEVAIRPVPGGKLVYFGAFRILGAAIAHADKVTQAIANGLPLDSLRPKPKKPAHHNRPSDAVSPMTVNCL